VSSSYIGPLTELEQLFAPLLQEAPPSEVMTKEVTNAEAIRFLASDVSSPRVAIKTSYSVGAYPEAGLASILDVLRQPSGSQGSITIIGLGGAVNRTAADATAYVHRTADFLTLFRATWSVNNAAGLVAARVARLRELFASAQPYALPESYQNFTDPTLVSWQMAYYGTNFPELVRVKKTYDPDNVFHFPQGIPPNV
jgi:Berberine and berberine like